MNAEIESIQPKVTKRKWNKFDSSGPRPWPLKYYYIILFYQHVLYLDISSRHCALSSTRVLVRESECVCVCVFVCVSALAGWCVQRLRSTSCMWMSEKKWWEELLCMHACERQTDTQKTDRQTDTQTETDWVITSSVSQ